MDRRAALDMLAKAGVAAIVPLGRIRFPAAAGVDTVLEQTLPQVTMDDWKMTALEVTYAPSEADMPH